MRQEYTVEKKLFHLAAANWFAPDMERQLLHLLLN
jgi:hypothetical protein